MMNTELNKNKNSNCINVNLYSVVEAVSSSIEPGEEELVPWIVKHILETRNTGVEH